MLYKDDSQAQANPEAAIDPPPNQDGLQSSEPDKELEKEPVSDAEPVSEYTIKDDSLRDKQGENLVHISYDSSLLMCDSEDE